MKIGQGFKDRESVLDQHIAVVMGRLAQVFGLDSPRASIQHLNDFVSCCVDSYGILEPARMNDHIARAFYDSLFSTRRPTHSIAAVKEAFWSGFFVGRERVERYTRRPRS